MMNTKESVLTNYKKHVEIQQAHMDALAKQLNQISLSRLGLFVAEILLVAMIISWGFHWIYVPLMILPLLLFMVLVKKQVRVQQERERSRQLRWVYQNEVNTIDNRDNAYDDGEAYADEQHPYASDLDIYGPLSLYAYVNRCKTSLGQRLLAAAFGSPNTKDAIAERQEAVKELAEHIEDTFHFRARLENHQPAQLAALENQLGHDLPLQLAFSKSKVLRGYVAAVPYLMFGLLAISSYVGGLMWNVFGLVALFNAGFTFFNLKHINGIYYGFSGSTALLQSFSKSIEWTEKVSWRSAYIKSFFSNAGTEQPVSKEISNLASIIKDFDARLNMIVGFFLNLFFLWDLRCCIRLDQWYKGSNEHILRGLERISHFEELISFATLHYNEPAFTFPVITDHYSFNAVALGHPLINVDKRVDNSYEFRQSPVVDVVTGSNMAGKSTFLRTVGINMVLAFAGAPVCAKQLSLSIFRLLSYMRIKDSLNDQTSTFKAELNRLKMILEETRKTPNALVLIDEMLRGTNSKDKYLGSQAFIERMIAQRSTALFATHDLALSEMEDSYPDQLRNYHFDIQITENEMQFDYKLKHGACKTFNAAILLKQIGLHV